ncbi:hypothetical protein RB595_006470 [Gaeumannomyces hyphopodioides]
MEFVAALAGASFDEGKPSLFELLSEQQLAMLLPPTIRYLLTVATHRYPRHLLRVLNSFDEIYALASLIVERHYLRTRGGSFTEHFYGLKRERAGPVSAADLPRASAVAPQMVRDALRLRSRDVWRNLAALVLFPYLKRRLDEAHEVDAPRAALLGAAYNQPPLPGAPLRERLLYAYRWFLRRVYPGLNASYHLAALTFSLAYLFDGSRFHHPLAWLAGARVRRMNAADYRAIDALEKGVAGAGAGAGGASLLSPRGMASRALSGLSMALPASLLLLKFLEWWHASDFGKHLSARTAESLDLPPPVVTGLGLPERMKQAADSSLDDQEERRKKEKGKEIDGEEKEDEGEQEEEEAEPLAEDAPIATPSMLPILTVKPPADSSLCPICADDITTATACQTGVVYCYTCIHRWVAGEHPRQEAFMAGGKEGRWESGAGRCAVTGRRVLGGTEGLRRIMV